MDKEAMLPILADFFLMEFANDPMGVGDWLDQKDCGVDEFVIAVQDLDLND